MLISTTPTIEGSPIKEYIGVVFGEVISGIDFIRDMGAGFRNFFGGRSQGYEDELIEARNNALNEMIANAEKMGANAIVGMDLDFEVLGNGNNMMMVTCTGTAVII